MNFDEYKDEVTKAVSEWLEALQNKSRTTAEELKENASDLISSAKEAYPKRKEEIQTIVDDIMEKTFKNDK